MMQLIDTDAALASCCQRWIHSPALALDTEFVRVDTYYPKLCLLQVGDGHDAAVIDTLALTRLDPLLDILYDTGRVKVLHAGSQDLEIFARLRDAPLTPLFDTQIAAEMLGDGEQLGYAGLVQRRLGIELDKSLTRTNWARRPLRPAELEYAAADVTHLWTIYPMLRDDLATRGRLEWLREDCARLGDPAHYRSEPHDAWRRLKGFARLPPEARNVAAALAQWREVEAQRADRPRRWILSDDALYALASARPSTPAQLATITSLPAKLAKRHGTMLVRAIAEATANPRDDIGATATPLDTAQKRRFEGLRNKLGVCANQLAVPRGLLTNRAGLEQLVRHGPTADITLTHGWRSTVAAEVLAAADEARLADRADP